MNTVDFYQILGVTTNAEDFVIRAAYKALVQRYHPDKYRGPKEEALEKMHLINEAYEVLSNPVKRREYDVYQQETISPQDHRQPHSEVNFEIERDWSIAVEYYPELFDIVFRLSYFSEQLADEFKQELISSKRFDEAKQLADTTEQDFLEEHFGLDTIINNYVRQLFLDGKRQAAMEFNEALIVLGTKVNSSELINKFELKYYPSRAARNQHKEQQKAEILEKDKKVEELKIGALDEPLTRLAGKQVSRGETVTFIAILGLILMVGFFGGSLILLTL